MRPAGGPLAPPQKRRLSELPQPWVTPPKNRLSHADMRRVVQAMTNVVAAPGTNVQNQYNSIVRVINEREHT